MAVIVTGANGFIGSSLCQELSSKGFKVIAVVNQNDNNIKNIPNLQIIHCNLSNYNSLKDLIGNMNNVDTFYHFAWGGTSGNLRGDVDIQLINIKATCEAVNICREIGCKKFIYAASIMEYEISAYMQTDKKPSKNTIYSTAKLSADYMARALANTYDIKYIRAVISNVYGPGEYSKRLINTSIRKMLKGEKCSFSSGEQLYDFIYIDDAVRAFIELGLNGKNNKTYYIGNSQPRMLKEFLLEMRDNINPCLDIGLGEIAFDGVSLKYNEFNVDSLKNDTGFIPQTSFSTGINKTVEWIKENEDA